MRWAWRWLLALLLPTAPLLGTSPLPARQAAVGEDVYPKLMKAVVWLLIPRGENTFATGTGVLVDSDRRLVVTNYHLVGEAREATVVFPQYTSGGRLIAERAFYANQVMKKEALVGKVLARKPQHDLALVQLPRLPRSAQALILSNQRVRPGQRVHAVGNPGASSGGMWLYTEGKVRQTFFGELRTVTRGQGELLVVRANLVETTNPTNEGDSGGPLANDQGELVGVTQGGARDARLLSYFIDVIEVKGLLAEAGIRYPKAGPATEAVAAPSKPPRDAQAQERQARQAAADLQGDNELKIAAALKTFSDGYALVYTEVLAETLPKLKEPTLSKGRAVLARRLSGFSTLALQAYLQAPDAELRCAAATAVALKRDREVLPDLLRLLDDPQDFVAAAALRSLKELTGKDAGRSAADWRPLLFPQP